LPGALRSKPLAQFKQLHHNLTVAAEAAVPLVSFPGFISRHASGKNRRITPMLSSKNDASCCFWCVQFPEALVGFGA
jgi:hypothetical protein